MSKPSVIKYLKLHNTLLKDEKLAFDKITSCRNN